MQVGIRIAGNFQEEIQKDNTAIQRMRELITGVIKEGISRSNGDYETDVWLDPQDSPNVGIYVYGVETEVDIDQIIEGLRKALTPLVEPSMVVCEKFEDDDCEDHDQVTGEWCGFAFFEN